MAKEYTIKFNNGRGAVLCPICENIVHYGFAVIEQEMLDHLRTHDAFNPYEHYYGLDKPID